jgi:uncharacterized DUF497 family protein
MKPSGLNMFLVMTYYTTYIRMRLQWDVLLVAHVYREDVHGEEIIRIISARPAEKHDIRRYQEQENA